MTARNPLVIVAGVVKELPSGDTINGASGGGSSTIFPVRWYDNSGSDSGGPPTGIPDLSGEAGPTLSDGDHIAGSVGVWAVHSGSWTSVHTWVGGDIFYVTAGSYSDYQTGLVGIFADDGAGINLVSNALIGSALASVGLSGLADVDLTAGPSPSDLLAYDFGPGKWVPLTSLAGTPSDGDTLRWDAGGGHWTFGP